MLGFALPWTLNAQVVESGLVEPPSVRLHYSTGTAILEIVGKAEGYSVEVSGDMKNWNELGEAEAGRPGEFEFEDNTAIEAGTRFYRVVGKNAAPDTSIVIKSYADQMRTVSFQQAMVQVSRADLQRTLDELDRVLAAVLDRIGELEERASTHPTVTQGGRQMVVRWNGTESVFNDEGAVQQALQEIEEERRHIEEQIGVAQSEADALVNQIARVQGDLGDVQTEIDALSLMADDLSVSIFALDQAFWNSPCFQHAIASAALAAAKADRLGLEQQKNTAQTGLDRSLAEAEKARARTWFGFGGNAPNETAILVFDGKRKDFQTVQEGQQYVENVIQPAVEQAKTDVGLYERDAETFGAQVEALCGEIAALDEFIAQMEAEVAELARACGNMLNNPVQQAQDLALELMVLESVRDMILNEKSQAEDLAEDAENRAAALRSISEQPINIAEGNEIWVFWNGGIDKFIDPIMAEIFIQTLEGFRQIAAEDAVRAREEADRWNQRVRELCDELEQINGQIAIVKDNLNAARAAANNGVGNNNGGGGANPAADRDLLDLLIALTEAIRSAVAAEKADAVTDAANLQDKADTLAHDANSAVSLVAPKDGQPYFIVQGIGGVVNIPVVPFPFENQEQAIERTRQMAEALRDQFERDREAARANAAKAQADADAAAAKAKKLCDELDQLDAELAVLIQQRATAAADAAAAAATTLKNAVNSAIDCIKCWAKKIALAAARAAHAGLVQDAKDAEKDAKDARADADAKHAAASGGLSLVINHTTGVAIAAFGDEVHRFNPQTHDDPEGAARKKHKDLKEKRNQAKKDAAAAEQAAKAAEDKAKQAKDAVEKSQQEIDKCQKELDDLKKKCPLC